MDAARHGLTAEEILSALADDRFISLTNEGDGWRLEYSDEDGDGSMENADLDALLADWRDYLAKESPTP